MCLTVLEDVSHADDGITCFGSILGEFVECLFNSWHVLVGNVLTLSFVEEHVVHFRIFISDVAVDRLDIAYNPGILSCSTTLLFVKIVEFMLGSDRFSVIDRWVAYDNIDVILSLDSFTIDKQMKFTHTRYDDFFIFFIVLNRKSWVFALKSV